MGAAVAIVQPAYPAWGEHFTAGFEGCRLVAYNRDGHWTIFYGHTGLMPDGTPVGPKSTGTCEQAHAVLLVDLRHASAAVSAAATAAGIQLTEGQLVALTDLAFNCGPAVLGSEHTLGQRLAAGDLHAVGDAILLYENATIDGKRGPFLRDRRQHDFWCFWGGPVSPPAMDAAGVEQVDRELAAAGL